LNQINPIYLALLLLVFLSLSVFKLDKQRSELADAKNSFKSTQILSSELRDLKDAYSNQSKIKRELNKILNNNVVKSSNIVKVFKKSLLKVSSESMDINALNKLMGKTLNSSYNITSLKIKRLSDTKASFYMEIKW